MVKESDLGQLADNFREAMAEARQEMNGVGLGLENSTNSDQPETPEKTNLRLPITNGD